MTKTIITIITTTIITTTMIAVLVTAKIRSHLNLPQALSDL